MFAILDVIYLAALMFSDIAIYSDDNYHYPKTRDEVVAISSHREWWRSDGSGKCKYTGLMVPFARDWEEEAHSDDPFV